MILPSFPWPCASYMQLLLSGEPIFIDRHENFIKQTYRSRTRILGANGPLDLVIPVKHPLHRPMHEMEISFATAWQRTHWRAIESAYRKSPFFDHFESAIFPLYSERIAALVEWNTLSLQCLLGLLREDVPLRFSDHFMPYSGNDPRQLIHPKKPQALMSAPYMQTFSDRFAFVADLSALDVVFNLGLQAAAYFRHGRVA